MLRVVSGRRVDGKSVLKLLFIVYRRVGELDGNEGILVGIC